MIAVPLLLLLAAPQMQGPEARELAVAWVAEPPAATALEAQWDAADLRGRRTLLEAAWLAKTPEGLALLGRALADAPYRGREPWTSGFLRIALENGEVPGRGVLADWEGPAADQMQILVSEGWQPSERQLRDGLDLDRVRETCLKALLARPRAAFAAEKRDTSAWTSEQRYFWDLHRVQFLPEARTSDNLGALARRALLDPWNFEQRRFVVAAMQAIAPLLPADCLQDTWTSADLAQRSSFIAVLEHAPRDVAWEPLRITALTTTMPIHDRARAVRRLFALDGPRASLDLLGLAAGTTPDPVLQPALFGMRNFGDAACADALEAILPELQSPNRGMALEVMILYGDDRQQRAWEPLYPTLEDTEKRAVLRAASWSQQEGIRERLWGMVYGPVPAERAIAETILREFLKPDELVDGARPYVEGIEDPALRVEELMRLARQQSDRVVGIVRRAFADPALAAQPRAVLLATRLIEDEASREMFRGWWADPAASPDRRYLAACALAAEGAEFQRHLRDEFWNVELGYQISAMGVLRALPDAHNLAAARAWMGDSRMELPGRLYCATTLLEAIGDETPHAVHEVLAGIREFRDAMAIGIPVDRVCGAFLLGAYERETPGLREAVEQAVEVGIQGRSGGADILKLRIELRQAALGLGEIGPAESLARILAGLRAPMDVRPWDQEPNLREVSSANAALDFEASRYAAFDDAVALPLLEQALRAKPGAWHPDFLWLLRMRWERAFPEALAVVGEMQRLVEPYGSLRLPPAPAAEPLPPDLETDQARFFERLEHAVMSGDLATADILIGAGLVRFDGDRRLRQWLGWTQIARGDLDGAAASFHYAHHLGGTLPYLHMEQTLGLAVIAELRDPASSEFDDFMDYEEQAGNLLRARLPVEARPDLAALLPSEPADEPTR